MESQTVVATEAALPPPSLLAEQSPSLVPEIRSYLARYKAAIEASIGEGSSEAGLPAGRRYSRVYDGLLSALFQVTRASMQGGGGWQPFSLAAVGSYGRRTLSPHSDLDVRLVHAGDPTALAAAAEALLYPLWDAGLSIGHQVVAIDEVIELGRSDLPTATALLDWRNVASDSDATEALLARAFQGIFGDGGLGPFLDQLEARTRLRHERFGGSVYLLEPDVKNGEGGLRDLDAAHWTARARWQVQDLEDLVVAGILVTREWEAIEKARELLFRIRNTLHALTGRKTDRLSFDLQEQVSERFGYGAGGAAVERFMGDYYRAARAVSRAREMLASRARPAPRKVPRQLPIGRGMKLQGDAVSVVDASTLTTDPALAFRVYDEAIRRNLPVYDYARHAIARAVASEEYCEALRSSKEASELFLSLVSVVEEPRLQNGSVLKELHDVGLLVAMIPEFMPLVGRVHHDVYHVYTVDVHSVAAVDKLRALCRGDLARELPLACRLAAEHPRKRALFCAVLLHDIGKGDGGAGHSERGAPIARKILERLGAPERDIVEVEQHVQLHLRMYHVATRRDVDDPRTVAEFCAQVRGQEALRELYLLTVADVMTTNPASLTTWKRRMLDALYVAADRHFERTRAGKGAPTEVSRHAVLDLWPAKRDRAFLEQFLNGLPERYLLANDAAVVVAHAAFAESAQSRTASVRAASYAGPYVEVWVVADDRPGLLAMIAATFTSARLKVLSAQIYSWVGRDGRSRSLDVFWVKGREGQEFEENLVPGLEVKLRALLSDELDPFELARKSPNTRASYRPTPPVPTRVTIDNASATHHTVVEVITRDRPALLFWLSTAIQEAGLSIWLAKINTEGERIADVFYVSLPDGGKLVDKERVEGLRERLTAAVERLDRM